MRFNADKKEATYSFCDSTVLGFATAKKAMEYYKNNDLLQNSYCHEFKLKEGHSDGKNNNK
jgi:hypothetical protein